MIIGGLDVGTTGCKIALYNEKATLVDTYYYEYKAVHQNGTHEIDFHDVKNGVLSLLKEAVSKYRIDALGVTSFGETFAMLDENDNILTPSMLYTDPRGKEQCECLEKTVSKERLIEITGVSPNPMYSIAKIMWQKENRPDEFSKTRHILLGEDFIVYTLTGNAVVDYSLAARTAAFDIKNKCYSKEILSVAGIDEKLLSKPVPTGSIAGKTLEKINDYLGIDYEITVINGAHDQIAGIIGSGVFESGFAMDGTGTVECIPVVLNEVPNNANLYDCGYSVVPFIGNKYACYALSFTGGATLKWFRDNFAEYEKQNAENENKNVYALLDGSVPEKPTEILILPHFAGAATPYMDSNSKAAMVGITLETTKFDIYKALMEGTSYEMLLNFNVLKEFTGDVKEIRATGGGATSDVWLQIKADILDAKIVSLDCKEVGAAGTAALAGVAIGAFDNLKETVSKMVPTRKEFVPKAENTKKYKELFNKYKDLYYSVKNLGKE